MKILCCEFFPALQRTLEYKTFHPGEVNRTIKVSVAASGKATNTARVLAALGAEPLMLSFAGGGNGQTVRDLLETEQLPCRWVETKSETRICQTLLANGRNGCTELVEENPPLSAGEWRAFIKIFASLESHFDRIVFSGNLPPHAPQGIYAELLAHTDASKVLLDSSGAPLLATLKHRPALVKLNTEELRNTFESTEPLEELANELMAHGAGAVGVTQGKSQAFLFEPDTACTFTVPKIKVLNPIGSGDSVSAGTTYALSKGSSLPEAFAFGLACGTSNAMNIEPGVVKPEQLAQLAPELQRSRHPSHNTNPG